MAFDGYFHLLVRNYENDLRQRREVRNVQRHLRDTSNPFSLPTVMFLKLFRLNKECAQLLINSLWPFMDAPQKITRIPIHLRVLSALHFFGQGSYQLGIGHGYLLAESQPVVSRCIAEVSDAIVAHLMHVWIKFPNTHERRVEVKRGFQEVGHQFRDVVGVVDCTHIRIVSPPANHPVHPGNTYFCRKNFFSINVQIIGDSNRKITSMNARFPGSVHDSAIWMLSGIKAHLLEEYVNNGHLNYLLGDSGYPLEPWLLVPFVNPNENSPQSRFNTSLSHIRIIIEHINGLLKGRFRCIHGHRALHYNPVRAGKIIYSCAVLHNMCRTYNVPMPEDDQLPNPPRPINHPPPPNEHDWFNQGNRIRQQIVQTYFENVY